MKPKKLTRLRRLAKGEAWIKTYPGKNTIKGYCKKFKVDKLCAIKELRLLGVEITKEREEQIRKSIQDLSMQRQRRKEKRELASDYGELFGSDENFAFIAGFTAGGFPYGTTHEEMEEIIKKEKIQEIEAEDFDDLPF